LKNKLSIGILGIQGDVEENLYAVRSTLDRVKTRGDVMSVRYSEEIENVDGLVIPGGESTVTSTLASRHGDIFETIKKRISEEMPIMGICAGMIILSKRAYDRAIGETKQALLSALDIVVERNAFGRQNNSFEAYLAMPLIGKKKFKGIFIRAPIVNKIGDGVEIIAKFNEKIVAVKQNNIIGTAFHPELAGDDRLHSLFVKNVLRFKRGKESR
jgi:5'-phosphate synthase pdxT subunit